MLRPIGRFGFVLVVGAIATIFGSVTALTVAPAGRALLARTLTEQSHRLVRGEIWVGGIRGNFVGSIVLDSVEIRDTTGFPLAIFSEIEVGYRLGNILSRRILLDPVRITRPRIHLLKHREGRLNLEEILKLGGGEAPDGRESSPPPFVELRNVTITDGIVTIRTPWSPPGQLRQPSARDSALRAQRMVPGRRIEDHGPEGLFQVRSVEGLDARFGEFRIVTPDRQPIHVIIESFAAQVSDPLMNILDARADITAANDTLRFTLEHAQLPRTVLSGEGTLSWPSDTLLFDFDLVAPEVALEDFRFVSDRFPDFTGSGRIEARPAGSLETQFNLPNLVLSDETSSIRGSMVARTHRLRGLGFRGLRLNLDNLDFDVIRPYLDTIPFQGRLSGPLEADGFFDAMQVTFDWSFYDERILGLPRNQLAMTGLVTLGGTEGMEFHGTRVSSADLDLETVRLAAPSVILEGRAQGTGVLEGPWRDVVYSGRIVHRDGDRGESIASGRFGLNTRDTLTAFDAEFSFSPLEFEGIRRSFPSLTTTGRIWGPVRLRGRMDDLSVEADVQGGIGRLRALGKIAALPPRWMADSLWLGFEDLDLQLLRGSGPPTRLNGESVMIGALDSATAPSGSLRLTLGPSWIGALAIDSSEASLSVIDSLITVDTATVGWAGGTASAKGTLGWTAPHTGSLGIRLEAPTIAAFDSTLTAFFGVDPDTTKVRERLSGTAVVEASIAGALDSLDLLSQFALGSVQWNGIAADTITGDLDWRTGGEAGLSTHIRVDTLQVGRFGYGDLRFDTSGRHDAVTWHASGRDGRSSLDAGGIWFGHDSTLALEQVQLAIGPDTWQLRSPTRIGIGESLVLETPLQLESRFGGAQIVAEGSIPHRGEGDLDLRMFGVELPRIATLLQRDTADLRGSLMADLAIGGTARAPTIRGTAALTGPVFGDFRAPLNRVALNYRNRRLDANVTFWRTGRPVMEVGATLPIELAWMGVQGSRQLDGDLAIRAYADSMDLAVLEAFSPNLRQVTGTVRMDAVVQGSWDAPTLGGTATITGGGATVPPLRTRYGPIDGRVHFAGDSIVVDTFHVRGESGSLGVTGHVRLARLTQPVLGLDLHGEGFKVLDVPDFLLLEADGDVHLRGPVTQPVMTGQATARNSVLYFSDLVSKTIVNLEDPLYADLVDTAAIRRGRLGAAFQSRFLDSLAIRDFTFLAADRVWLRSNEANIQMEGSVTVDKTRRTYRLEGTFSAARGTYTLRLGPVTRAFDVTRGVVRYFGTPDLNAALDVEARHVIRDADGGAGQELAVIAKITGSLLTPSLALESTIRPPLSQSDLISLLLLGQTVNAQVATDRGPAYQTVAVVLAGALTSELERSLIASQRVGIDMIEIRPGLSYGGIASGTSLTRLAAGWQLGSKWFVSLNAGFCPNLQQFDYRNFGAGLEYRLSRQVSFSASAEPVQVCLNGAPGVTSIRYQFGTDLRWTKEY